MKTIRLAAALGALALVVPGVVQADKGGNGKGHGKTKSAQYNVKGTYAGDGVVSVTKASGHARKAGWKGTDVAFDFSTAKIRVADTNGDTVSDLADVQVGDRVRVKARLPKRDPGAGPYVAQRLVDKTNSPEDSDDDGSEEEEESGSEE